MLVLRNRRAEVADMGVAVEGRDYRVHKRNNPSKNALNESPSGAPSVAGCELEPHLENNFSRLHFVTSWLP